MPERDGGWEEKDGTGKFTMESTEAQPAQTGKFPATAKQWNQELSCGSGKLRRYEREIANRLWRERGVRRLKGQRPPKLFLTFGTHNHDELWVWGTIILPVMS